MLKSIQNLIFKQRNQSQEAAQDPDPVPNVVVIEESELEKLKYERLVFQKSALSAEGQYLGVTRTLEGEVEKGRGEIQELREEVDYLERSNRRKLVLLKKKDDELEIVTEERDYYKDALESGSGDPGPGSGPGSGLGAGAGAPEGYVSIEEHNAVKAKLKATLLRLRLIKDRMLTEKRARWVIQELKERYKNKKTNWAKVVMLDSYSLIKMLLYEAPLAIQFDNTISNLSQSVIYVMNKVIKIAEKEGLSIFEGTTHSKFTDKMKILRYEPSKYRPAALAKGLKRKYAKKKLGSIDTPSKKNKEYASWYQRVSGKMGPDLGRDNPLEKLSAKYLGDPERGKIQRS